MIIPEPKTLEEALDRMYSNLSSQDTRWQLLALILREFMLSQGVDLDKDIEKEGP